MKKLLLSLLTLTLALTTMLFVGLNSVGASDYTFSSANMEVSGNKFTLTSGSGVIDITSDAAIADSGYISLKYIMSSDISFNILSNDNDWLVAGVTANSKRKDPWNCTEYVVYPGNMVVATFSYSGSAIEEINLNLSGAAGSTFELLDCALTSDGVHGFTLPMAVSEPEGYKVTIEKGVEGWDFSYTASPTDAVYRSLTFNVTDYDATYNTLVVKVKAEIGTNLGIRLYYTDGSYSKVMDHWSSSNNTTTETVTVKYTAEAGKTVSYVIMYLDPGIDTTTHEGSYSGTVTCEFREPQLDVSEIEVPSGISTSHNANGEQVISYSTSTSSYYNAYITNYSAKYKYLNLKFTPTHDTVIFFIIRTSDNTKYEHWGIGYKTFEANQEHSQVIDLSEIELSNGKKVADYSSFRLQLLIDNGITLTEENSITIHSLSLYGDEPAAEPTLDDLLKQYYNEGSYTKDTVIYADMNKIGDEVETYFHASASDLERTTVYVDGKLTMTTESNPNGAGYKTVGSDMVRFHVEGKEEVVDFTVANTTVEDYYVTLYDFVAKTTGDNCNYGKLDLSSEWTLVEGVYSSKDADVLEAFRLFVAPMWIYTDAEYIQYEMATIEVVDGNLVMSLYVSSLNSGLFADDAAQAANGYYLLAQATISLN